MEFAVPFASEYVYACQWFNFQNAFDGSPDGLQQVAGQLRPGLRAEFVKQPPASHRKTNYLEFALQLQGIESPIRVKEAKFEKFIDSGTIEQNQNGMLYRVTFWDETGYEFMKYLIIWLVDSVANKLIVYEGKDRGSPAYNRVLQNHRTTCHRCLSSQNCGNANEKPDDPQVDPINVNTLKFHLKCEQNCQRSSGNQRQTRRFKLVVEVSDADGDPILRIRRTIAESTAMFIHNNSKQPKSKKGALKVSSKRIYKDSQLTVNGVNFHAGCNVYLNEIYVDTVFFSDTELVVFVPDLGPSGKKVVSVTEL